MVKSSLNKLALILDVGSQDNNIDINAKLIEISEGSSPENKNKDKDNQLLELEGSRHLPRFEAMEEDI